VAAITDAEIRAAIRRVQSGARRVTLSDGHGKGGGRLQLMVRPARHGALCEWYAAQHQSGRRRLAKLGVYPQTTLAQARATFAGYSVKIRQGVAVRHAKPAPDTLAAMLAAYCDTLDNPRSQAERQRVLIKATDSACAVIGGKRRAADVTAADISAWLRQYHQRGAIVAADSARKHIRAAYSWALASANDYRTTGGNDWGLTVNPAGAIPSDPDAKRTGERSLSPAEFGAFVRYLRSRPDRAARCVELIALTGQRVEEIAHLKPDNLVDGALFWSTTKTGKPHYLPLPDRGVEILTGLDSDLFAGLDAPALRAVCVGFSTAAGVDRFSTRDLRRTWKTLAGEAGVSKDDRDLVQNHARAGISSRHYDRYQYLSEKRAAMARWSDWAERHIASVGDGGLNPSVE